MGPARFHCATLLYADLEGNAQDLLIGPPRAIIMLNYILSAPIEEETWNRSFSIEKYSPLSMVGFIYRI